MFGLFRRKPKVREATPQDVVDALAGLQKRLNSLEDDLALLTGQYRRMRGYVYAKKGALLDTAGDDDPSPRARKAYLETQSRRRRLTKAELRELAGITPPGSAAAPAEVHTDE